MGRGYTCYSYVDEDVPDEWPLHSAYLVYLLDDGTTLGIVQSDYYCQACDRFVVGEHIETIAELENRINEIKNDPQSDARRFAEFIGNIPRQIAELHVRINWRKQRQSPPKCLECGTMEILPIPNQEEFAHPATGQRMKVKEHGFASAARWQATFTPEGDLIESSGT